MVEMVALPGGSEWQVGDTTFVFDYGRSSTAGRFLLRKPPDLVELYVDLSTRFQQGNVVELGIAAGGSTALLSLLTHPRRLVSCELDGEPVAALTEFIERRGLGSVIRPYYGVDQADRARLTEIVDAELPGQVLDLVIDDASHLHDETRSSFEVLFPRLRPGGVFIIEDWAADYEYAKRIAATLSAPSSPTTEALEQRLADVVAERPQGPTPLPRIGVELLQICGTSGEVVSELKINKHWIMVERGPAALDAATFQLADHYEDHWHWFAEG